MFAAFDPNNPATWVSTGGGIGLALIIFWSFIKGWIVPGFILDRAEERIKEQDAQIAKFTDLFQEQVIPALTKATSVNEEVYEYLLSERGPKFKRRVT